jgi:hypothetical protein
VNDEEDEEEEKEEFSDDVFTDEEDNTGENFVPSMLRVMTNNMFGRNPHQVQQHKSKPMSRAQSLVSYYDSSVYQGSDVDIFLYAISNEEAEQKIRELASTFKKNLHTEHLNEYVDIKKYRGFELTTTDHHEFENIFIIRTKQAVTFHFKYPIRPIQVILRIYKSPAEVLMGFDLDCCAVGYDGKQVWALPRARRAINTRMNLIDVDRQSTTYEVRLFKYAKRGFRVVS